MVEVPDHLDVQAQVARDLQEVRAQVALVIPEVLARAVQEVLDQQGQDEKHNFIINVSSDDFRLLYIDRSPGYRSIL